MRLRTGARLGVLLALLFILVCLLAMGLRAYAREVTRAGRDESLAAAVDILAFGGADQRSGAAVATQRRASENIVVDTLNLAHWLRPKNSRRPLSECDIVFAIRSTAPALRRRYPGRIAYVLKDRDSSIEVEERDRARELFKAAAADAGVEVHLVEKREGAHSRAGREAPHSAAGRDDFYIALLAWKWRCAVLSRDRFRDLGEMKSGNLESFSVIIYRAYPNSRRVMTSRDFVTPAAAEFRRMGRPITVDYEDVLRDASAEGDRSN